MKRFCAQSFRLPAPTLTEHNCPDQSGRVIIVTGGYAGVGLEFSKILYARDATVYVAGRSQSKAEVSIKAITASAPQSRGSVHFLPVDLADRSTIKKGVAQFLARETRLDVLVNNAGVMFPPKGTRDAHGEEVQIGTNCLGHWLLYRLLEPILAQTAGRAAPGSVRVFWAGSTGIDLFSVSPGGLKLDASGRPVELGPQKDYGQSKVGNLFFSWHESRRTAETGVVHLCGNPGNLKTELQRHSSALESIATNWMLHPAVFGAYTELWAVCSAEVSSKDSGKYVWPWGRFGSFREDIKISMKSPAEEGTGIAEKFVQWCDEQVKPYA